MQQLTANQHYTRDISYLLQKLADKYTPLQIYCFHKDEKTRKTEGCFDSVVENQLCDYWLLMILENTSRIENAVQDFVNAHYDFGKITILAHNREGIAKSIQEGYTFFANVYRTGKLLYSPHLNVNESIDYTLRSPARQEWLSQRFEEGISRAEGFLKCALECRSDKRYNISAFMLHQAVEQCCIALIGRHMDYRCDIHNLDRLLRLCRCFTRVPYDLFISGQPNDSIAFDRLVKSYCQARYGCGFSIEAAELDLLIAKASELVSYSCQLN